MTVPEDPPNPNPSAPLPASASAKALEFNPLIPVMGHARVCAWPPDEQTGQGEYLPLSEALRSPYACDAHFAAYSRPDKPPRLKNEAVPLLAQDGGVAMVLMVFDVDCEEAHRTKQPAPDSWWEEEGWKIGDMERTFPNAFVARSRGGYRIVYRLAEPFVIRNNDDKAAWTLFYRRCVAHLACEFCIVADPKCADWTRLYRAPHATREVKKSNEPEMLEVHGDAHNVGVWRYIPTDSTLDVEIKVAGMVARRESPSWQVSILKPLLRQQEKLRGATHPPLNRTAPADGGAGVQDVITGRSSGATVQAASIWLASYPAAIEGNGGDAVTFKAALGLVKGHGLPLPIALDLLLNEYNARCKPPWTQPALEHKLRCAQNSAVPSGYLLLPVAKALITIRTAEHEVVDDAEAALAKTGGLYQRYGLLVDVVRDARPRPTAKEGDLVRPPRSPNIIEVSTPRLRDELTRVANWQQANQKGELNLVHPPKWLPEELIARGQWHGVRHLEGVVETPILRPDGSILQLPGYDAQTCILFEPNAIYLPVSDAPTQADAIRAKDELMCPFCDFPFVSPEHWAATLAAVLTLFSPFAYEGPAPLIAVDAPVAGTGKSLLVDAIATIATGRVMSRMSHASTEDEERKRITAIVLSGDRVVLFDNITRPLGSGTLDAALTGEDWKDRMLGGNKLVSAQLRVAWFVTANNLQVVGDTARRILNIRLDPKMEQPEERTAFKRPKLLDWIRKERPRLVQAALTILRAYFVAGAPAAGLSGWGSYEGWSRVVRGAVMFVGLPDPAETRNELRGRADTEMAAFANMLEGLEALCAGRKLEAAEIVTCLHTGLTHGRLYTALLELRPLRSGQSLDASALGYTLRKFRDRRAGKRRLASEKVGDRQKWFVETDSSSPAPATGARATTAPVRGHQVGEEDDDDGDEYPAELIAEHERMAASGSDSDVSPKNERF